MPEELPFKKGTYLVLNYPKVLNLQEKRLLTDPIFEYLTCWSLLLTNLTKVVGETGKYASRVTSDPRKQNITILLMANPAGEKSPPLIIYKGLYVGPVVCSSEKKNILEPFMLHLKNDG